eukprot:bmy_02074T0
MSLTPNVPLPDLHAFVENLVLRSFFVRPLGTLEFVKQSWWEELEDIVKTILWCDILLSPNENAGSNHP